MSALLQAHSRPSADLFDELHAATNSISSVVDSAKRRARDHDKRALELLERIAERFAGLQRLAMMTREALRREHEQRAHLPRSAAS